MGDVEPWAALVADAKRIAVPEEGLLPVVCAGAVARGAFAPVGDGVFLGGAAEEFGKFAAIFFGGVAEGAGGADFGAADPGVKGAVAPFDSGEAGHLRKLRVEGLRVESALG